VCVVLLQLHYVYIVLSNILVIGDAMLNNISSHKKECYNMRFPKSKNKTTITDFTSKETTLCNHVEKHIVYPSTPTTNLRYNKIQNDPPWPNKDNWHTTYKPLNPTEKKYNITPPLSLTVKVIIGTCGL